MYSHSFRCLSQISPNVIKKALKQHPSKSHFRDANLLILMRNNMPAVMGCRTQNFQCRKIFLRSRNFFCFRKRYTTRLAFIGYTFFNFKIAVNKISKISLANNYVNHCIYADDLYILCKKKQQC